MSVDNPHGFPSAETAGPRPGQLRSEPLADDPSSLPDGRRQTPLERRIELARLRARVTALERSLAEQERRRQAVVDHYELLLEEREERDRKTDADDRERRDDARSSGALRARVRRRLRTLRPALGIGHPTP